MLYHVPDRSKALSEIKRVLKPTGRFYSSTRGCNQQIQITNFINTVDSKLSSWGNLTSDTFSLENGSTQLGDYFTNVLLFRYSDSLIVTDANLLIDYILSGRIELSADQQLDLAKFVEQELKANDGKFYITKDSGVFESNNILQR